VKTSKYNRNVNTILFYYISNVLFFYVYCSVHRWSILIIVHWDATQSSLFIILQVHSTCFGCQPHPTSGVYKTSTTASGTAVPSSNVAKLEWPRWREVAVQKIWPVPVAVVTVLCTADNGCGWHPKHVEWTCRIRNGGREIPVHKKYDQYRRLQLQFRVLLLTGVVDTRKT